MKLIQTVPLALAQIDQQVFINDQTNPLGIHDDTMHLELNNIDKQTAIKAAAVLVRLIADKM